MGLTFKDFVNIAQVCKSANPITAELLPSEMPATTFIKGITSNPGAFIGIRELSLTIPAVVPKPVTAESLRAHLTTLSSMPLTFEDFYEMNKKADQVRFEQLVAPLSATSTNLEKLIIEGDLHADSLAHIDFPPVTWSKLKFLKVQGMKGFLAAPQVATALASSKFPELTTLEWIGNNPTVISCSSLSHISAQAIAASIARGEMPKITSLNLEFSGIGDEGAIALAAAVLSGNLRGLVSLNLTANNITPHGMLPLVMAINSSSLPLLTTLTLGDNTPVNENIRIVSTLNPTAVPNLNLISFNGHFQTHDEAVKGALRSSFPTAVLRF